MATLEGCLVLAGAFQILFSAGAFQIWFSRLTFFFLQVIQIILEA